MVDDRANMASLHLRTWSADPQGRSRLRFILLKRMNKHAPWTGHFGLGILGCRFVDGGEDHAQHHCSATARSHGTPHGGREPCAGSTFYGGGNFPFKAARIGCESYGSDFSPVTALLTKGALEIVGGGEDGAERVSQAQVEIFDAVDRQATEWRIVRIPVDFDHPFHCIPITDSIPNRSPVPEPADH